MNVEDVLKIVEGTSKRKIPYDVLDEESVYVSESRGYIPVPILKMDIIYLIRAFKKVLRENYKLNAHLRG